MTIVDPPIPQVVTKQMIIDPSRVFPGRQPGSALVIHKTAGGSSAEQIATYFATDTNGASSHFVVGQDGHVVQCVHLVDGAGANCCLESGHDPFWDGLAARFTNLNWCTISIEHVDAATDNSSELSPAQKQASFTLIKWLVDQYGFDISPDGKGQMKEIKGHNTLDSQSRARCPGNYPWNELIDFLKGRAMTDTTQQALQDEWNSTAHLFGGTPPPYNTGIAAWWRDYTHQHASDGNRPGPPLTVEQQTIDWQGNQIIIQQFCNKRVEWVNGTPHVY